jgi:serine/threonine protein kinase
MQLLLALDLMHKNKIIHRDIKPDNILILKEDELNVCIADLGMACKTSCKDEIQVKCGSPGYVDPDVLKGAPFNTKSDIFSTGSLLFNLITGKLLFGGNNIRDVLKKNQFIDPRGLISI